MSKTMRIISLILCIISICMCFTGCGKKEKPVITPEQQAIDSGKFLKPAENEEYRYDEYTTYIELKKYIGMGGDVVVPETIDDKPVYAISAECYAKNNSITSIVMHDKIIKIGKGTMYGSTNIKMVKLPSNILTIPKGFAQGCTSLSVCEIPSSVTQILDSAFAGCAFDNIVIPGTVQFVGANAFKGCVNAERIIVMHGNIINAEGYLVETRTMTIGANAFADIYACSLIVLPDTVVSIGNNAFKKTKDNAVFYGYASSQAARWCSATSSDFYEIVDGDEFDRAIKQKPTKFPEEKK